MRVNRTIIAAGCISIWLIVVGLFFVTLAAANFGKLLALSSFILITHILFAGYYLMGRLKNIDIPTVLFSAIIAVLILLAPFTTANYRLLTLDFLILFLAAMFLHQHVLSLKVSPKLDFLAHYKIRLELGLIAYIALECLLFWWLKSLQAWIALGGVLFLLSADYVVIVKHQIYHPHTVAD